ncbi:MAG: hypothetical protein KDC35_04520 [Acidobacteria bacterium]|nr:hypothetical protein [Acidobacteriota bacterium]
MREPVVFLHVISAMVLFGLPLAFGRFLSVNLKLGVRDAAAICDTLRLLTHRYLYLAWMLNLGTGLYLLMPVVGLYSSLWRHGVIFLAALVGANLFFGLERGLATVRKMMEGDAFESLRKRIVVFSIVHHTSLTMLTAAMVFRGRFI